MSITQSLSLSSEWNSSTFYGPFPALFRLSKVVKLFDVKFGADTWMVTVEVTPHFACRPIV